MKIHVHADLKRVERREFDIDIEMPYFGGEWDVVDDPKSFLRITPVFLDWVPDKVHYYRAVIVQPRDGFREAHISEKTYFPSEGNGTGFMDLLHEYRTPITREAFYEQVAIVKEFLTI